MLTRHILEGALDSLEMTGSLKPSAPRPTPAPGREVGLEMELNYMANNRIHDAYVMKLREKL